MDIFKQLIGHQQAINLLQQAVRQNRIAPAYLFVGSPGIGRTLAAKCFSAMLLAQKTQQHPAFVQKRLLAGNHPDFLWIEPTYMHKGKRISATQAAATGLERKAPPQIRIEQIREIAQFLASPPLQASRTVVVLEEAQTMAETAANALLKTLEEPGRATLILIAPTIESLIPTLVSRCQRIPFSCLNQEQMQQVLEQTGYEHILANETVLAIAQGSPGEAIYAWQQLEEIEDDLLNKLLKPPPSWGEALALAKEIAQTLDTPTQIWLINYLQYHYWQQLLNGVVNQFFLEPLEQARKALLCYAQPRLVWEVTLLAMSNE